MYICLTVSSATPVFSGAKEVQFRNVGNKEGTFSIDYDHELPVKIRPLRHTLAPGQVVNVQVDVEGRELGPIRSVVPRVLCRESSLRAWWADARGVPCRALATVEVDQQPPKILDISAQVRQAGRQAGRKRGLRRVISCAKLDARHAYGTCDRLPLTAPLCGGDASRWWSSG